MYIIHLWYIINTNIQTGRTWGCAPGGFGDHGLGAGSGAADVGDPGETQISRRIFVDFTKEQSWNSGSLTLEIQWIKLDCFTCDLTIKNGAVK